MITRGASFQPAPKPRAPRRGAFALEPADALPRLADRIEALAERSLEPNPFFLPDFLQPAIAALGRYGLKLAIFSDRDDLRFFAPVVAIGSGITHGPRLRVWTHPYAPLGTPLTDRDGAQPAAEALLTHLRSSRRRLIEIPDLPLNGPTAECLRAAAGRAGHWTEAARQNRPILQVGEAGGPEFEDMVSQKRRRELDRQLRKLGEAGAVSLMTAESVTEIESAFNSFIALEASGWKGRSGTALRRSRSIHDFARNAVLRFAENGRAAIDLLRVGEEPVAALIRLDHGGLSIPWKITFDERFAAVSPGKQLMCDATRRWLAGTSPSRVDPVCEEDNPLIAGLWTGREPYGTLILSPGRWGLGARMRAATVNLRHAGSTQAKRLLRGAKSPGKPRGGAAKASRKARPVTPPKRDQAPPR